MLIVALLIVWYNLGLLHSILSGAPYVATPTKDITTILELADISSHSVVYELGSGDGKLVIATAQAGAQHVYGIEINTFLVWWSRYKIARLRLRNATIVRGNILHTSFADATVVILYILPGLMKRLEPKLRAELKPGTIIISKGFPLHGWTPTAHKNGIFQYVVR